jgi:drug/metabolite transporter (DMT)-like permease
MALSRMARHDNFRGILLMLLAVFLLSCMDAGLKQLSAHYPPLQVAALRGAASLPFVVAWVLWSVGARSLLRVRWRLHLLRGVIGVVTLPAFIYGLRFLPLTTAYTLFFVAPLIITAMSALFLGEKVGVHRWGAIIVGFIGVLVALRPTGDGAPLWAGLAILGAATGYATAAVMVRVLGRTDSTQSMMFWMTISMTLGSAALALPGWVALRGSDGALILGVGLVGALGQWALTEAFARGEASVVAPFEYSALAWGIGFDLAFWGVLPDSITWLGAAIIVAAGIYLMRRERGEHPEKQLQP